MRRPLKPFVTEYKGSRRVSPSFGEVPSFESERPAPKPIEARARPDPESEDSHEAAMRAADALFSAPSDRKAGPNPDSFPREAQSDAAGRAPPDRGGGRILRVIDEPPPPQQMALESEHAPKRRGRKPGSKNKPKIPALTAAPALGDFATMQVADSTRTSAAVDVAAPLLPVPSQRRIAALMTVATSSRSEKRFPWVRDRLKPGEHWKRRRLPKVCW